METKPLLCKNRGRLGQCPSNRQRVKGRVNSKMQKGEMGKIKGNIVWYQGCFRFNTSLQKNISNPQPFIHTFKMMALGIMNVMDLYFFFSHVEFRFRALEII